LKEAMEAEKKNQTKNQSKPVNTTKPSNESTKVEAKSSELEKLKNISKGL
jgi:hypothetical protein